MRVLIGRDTAEQVWISTHGWFFIGYALADLLLLGVPVLVGRAAETPAKLGAAPAAGGPAVSSPPRYRVGTFLAALVPWWLHVHPAAWLYGMSIAWALVVAAAALAGPWRRDPLGPFGMICLFTLAVLGVDVMTGSRLQLETPFGLSLIEGGRFYGIGNEALGVYCVCALVGAAWLGRLASRRFPAGRPPRDAGGGRRRAVRGRGVRLARVRRQGRRDDRAGALPDACWCCGWPGIRIGWRRAVPVAVSGLALFAVFAVVSYFFPAAGVSDMGTFAGNLLHGQGGALLERKVSSNVGHAHGQRVQLADPGRGRGGLGRAAGGRPRCGCGRWQRAFAAEPLLRTVALADLAGARYRLVRR